MTAQPTLLVFTLGPDREQARRRLLPEPLNAVERQFHERCLDSTLEAGRQCGWQLAVSSPQELATGRDVAHLEQRGATFGGRFRRAFDAAFSATGGAVVAVGSDIPGLTRDHLTQAIAELESDPARVVLGPSPDGGFYLLAAARPLDDELDGVHWQRADTLTSLRRNLERSGREVVLLAPLEDLDRPVDLASWIARAHPLGAGWERLIGLLRRALAELCDLPQAGGRRAPRLRFATTTCGRAPPR